MKKKTKILVGILASVAVLITVTCIVLGSAGFFRYISSPEIVSIEITDTKPISFKEVQADRNEELTYMEDPVEDTWLSLNESNIVYTYKATLSDGSEATFTSQEWFGGYFDDKTHRVFIDAYVSYADCKEALEKGLDTVPVTIEAELYKGYYDEPVDTFETETTKAFTEKIVDKFELLFDENIIIEGLDYCFDSKKFKIKYADGTKKTLSGEKVEYKDKQKIAYTLDGEELICRSVTDANDDSYIKLGFFDCEEKIYVEQKYRDTLLTLKSFEVKDYAFGEGNEITEITYTVTDDDDVKTDYTVKSLGQPDSLNSCQLFEKVYIEGYAVNVAVYKDYKHDNLVIYIDHELAPELSEVIPAPEKIGIFDAFRIDYIGATFFSLINGLFVD